jgi:hypothetical protein
MGVGLLPFNGVLTNISVFFLCAELAEERTVVA